MIDPFDHRTQLLANAVHDDWAGGPMADFARRAAAHARQHRLRRRVQTAGAIACLSVAGFVLHPRWSSPPPHNAASSEHKIPEYEIISDDELLAELHDRPLLVIKKENGAHEFVFLDR